MCHRPGSEDGGEMTRYLLERKKATMKWISIKDELPEEFVTCFLRLTYENGNTGMATGYLDDGEWEIEWSDNHTQSKDISHWLKEI